MAIVVDPTPWGHEPPAEAAPATPPVIQRGITPDPPPPVEDWTSRTNYADPGLVPTALRAGVDWLKGPGFTTAVRGTGDLINTLRSPGDALYAPIGTLISPEGQASYEAERQKSAWTRPGTALGDYLFGATGLPEYQGQSGPERTLMAAGRGAVANAPMGLLAGPSVAASRWLPAIVGGASGAAGQATRELLPPGPMTERAATLASVAPAVVAGINTGTAPRQAEVPSTQALLNTGNAQFNATRASPVEISPYPLQGAARSAQADLYQRYDPMLMPQSERIIQNRIMRNSPMNFNDIVNLRESLTDAINDGRAAGNRHEIAMATRLLSDLDDHVANLGNNPAHITAGTPAEAATAAQTYQDARANYGAALRSNQITGELRDPVTGKQREPGLMGTAEAASQAQNAPSYDRTLRGQIKSFTKPGEVETAGWTQPEIDTLNNVMSGGFARNQLRNIAALFGGKPSMHMGFSAGAGPTAGHFLGLDPWVAASLAPVLPAAGMMARAGQTALARSAAENAASVLRQRSPAYQENLQNLPPRDIAVIQSILPGLLAPPAQPGTTGRGLLAQPEPPGGWIY